MSIEMGWQVATAVAGWLQQAIAAAKNRRQQRFAHIVENAGLIVAGLRDIDRQLHRLLLPLLHFDPQGWTGDKRCEWAERLTALAHEDIILPRMRAADSALAILATQEIDTEIVSLIDKIRYFPLEDVLSPYQYHRTLPPEQSEMYNLMYRSVILESMHTDVGLQNFIPDIIKALLGGDSGALEKVRVMARRMLGADYSLREMADNAEQNFGFLMGHQEQRFPGLPAPTWVWEY